jgi:ABC-type multidrug transport system permease subunit
VKFALLNIRKDWTRQRRDPMGLAISLGIPIVVGVLVTLASGGRDGPKPQAHVLVVDKDESFLSGLLLGAMGQGGAAGLVNAESVSEEDGWRRIGAGQATALLIIPEGFTEAVLREEPATLELRTNPAERILPEIVEEWVSVLVDGVFYAQRLLGEELRTISDGPPDSSLAFTNTWVAGVSVRINELVADAGGWLSPLVIALETPPEEVEAPVENTSGRPARSLALLFVPGLLMMSLVFAAQNVAEDLWREREAGTLRRLAIAPHAMIGLLLGKLFFGASVMFVISLPALTAAWVYFDVSWSRLPLAAVWTTFGGTLLLSMMILLQLFASSRRVAHMMGMAFTFPLLMLGGSFFPFDLMPAGMAAAGRLTPNGWALTRLVEIILGDWQAATLLTSAAGLSALVAVISALSVWRLKTGFARGS